MGLDMYLSAERKVDISALPESLILEAQEEPQCGAYTSGYSFQDENEQQMYRSVVQLSGMSEFASKDTPSATVYPDRIRVVVAYWRKANAIHWWFVKECQGGVDECQTSDPIPMAKLEELISICESVIQHSEMLDGSVVTGHVSKDGEPLKPVFKDGQILSDTSKAIAASKLPTSSGFFFGSTDYDEYYIEDLKRTINELTKLRTLPEGTILRYRSSW